MQLYSKKRINVITCVLLDAEKDIKLKILVLPNAKKGIFLTIRKVIGSKNIHCVKTKMLSTNKKCY